MPPHNMPPDQAEAWLLHAKGDLAIARADLPEGAYYEMLCWHCLQAAEKAIKAVLIFSKIEYPRIHVIEKLLKLLPNQMPLPEVVIEASHLTAYLSTRYPGEHGEIGVDEYRDALTSAENVVFWAEAQIGTR